MTGRAIPIVAYHSVADDHDHPLSLLSLPVRSFERQLRHLRRRGFQTLTLYDVHDYLKRGTAVPAKSVVLTFDDGYLDNWVFAFPLLKKYGMKASIFVITDFVEEVACRPTLEDVWEGRADERELEWWGYASWPELERMQKSGLVDVQSHTRTHTWYGVSDKIVDFHHPGDPHYWLFWNRFPAEKSRWLTMDVDSRVPWGTPVYEYAQTLLRPRYSEDEEVARFASDHVSGNGGREFFLRPGWKEELGSAVERFRAKRRSNGTYESQTAYEARISDELAGSKRIIEQRLGKSVDFLCWPCGEYTEKLQRFALDSGYLSTVVVKRTTNRRGDDPSELRRIVFGQDYKGPFKSTLIHMHFCGNVNFHSGTMGMFFLAPVARRLMMLGNLLR